MDIDFWSWVGRFSAVVGAVIAAITLWNKVFIKKHRVIFDYEELDNPSPDLRNAIEQLLIAKGPDAVERSSYRLEIESLSRGDKNTVVQALKPIVAEKFFSEIRYEDVLQKQRKLIRVVLENKGSKTAKSIVIDFEFRANFIEFNSDEMIQEGKKLKLPELRPGHKVVCDFWVGVLAYGGVKVTQEDHVLKPRRRSVSYGWRAFLVEVILSPVFIPLYFIYFFVAVAAVVALITISN